MTQIANDFAAPAKVRVNLEKLQFWGATLSQLMLRLAIAVPFISPASPNGTVFCSLTIRRIRCFRRNSNCISWAANMPIPAPHLMALISGSIEIAMPILLVLGLGTRLAALAIIGMTAVIQLTVPEGWANFHLLCASAALAIVVHGPGAISLDATIWRFFGRARFERFFKS